MAAIRCWVIARMARSHRTITDLAEAASMLCRSGPWPRLDIQGIARMARSHRTITDLAEAARLFCRIGLLAL